MLGQRLRNDRDAQLEAGGSTVVTLYTVAQTSPTKLNPAGEEEASMNRIAIAAALWLLPVSLCAQWLNLPTPGIPRTADGKPNLTAPVPRTPDGKPDLSGVWQTAAGN